MRTGRARVVVGVAGAGLVVALVLHRNALDELRSAEAAYVEGRQITACATAALAPFARPGADLDELPTAVEQLVVAAQADTEKLWDEASDLAGAVPYPRVAAAIGGVREALDAQRALYRELVDDPDASDDDLEALGVATRNAEAQLDRARSVLFVGAPAGWDDRNTCRQPTR